MGRKRTKLRIGDAVTITHHLKRMNVGADSKTVSEKKWISVDYEQPVQGIYVGVRVVSDGKQIITGGKDKYVTTRSYKVLLIAINHKQAVYANSVADKPQ